MIVLDASVLLELITGTQLGLAIGERIRPHTLSLHAPHLVDVEVTQVLRKCVRTGLISADRARLALDHLAALDIERYPHGPLLPRAWALRDNVSVYDGVYVALAEALPAILLTRDARLGGATQVHRARVEVFG